MLDLTKKSKGLNNISPLRTYDHETLQLVRYKKPYAKMIEKHMVRQRIANYSPCIGWLQYMGK